MSNENNGCISLTIPEGAQEGDLLTFLVGDGQELEIPVPVGSQPGDVLQLQLGSNETNETDHDETKMMQLDLGNGTISLELALELPKELQDDTVHKNAADTLSQTVDDGTHALPWQSGKELSKSWKEIISLLQHSPKRILELGSGLGLVGLSFAVSLQDKFRRLEGETSKMEVVLTDVPSAMPLLRHNLEQNQESISSYANIQAKALPWTLERPQNEKDDKPYDCIVGSDLLYNAKYIPHLVATTKRLLHPTRGIFILAARWRKPELERTFFQESGLEWTLVSGMCPLDWKEFGDAQNEKSNRYFWGTQISVQGRPTALADITDEEKLLEDEFEAWDRAHIQIYMGKQPKS